MLQGTVLKRFLGRLDGIGERRLKRVQERVVGDMLESGKITAEQAADLKTRGWREFLDYLLEHAPEFLELLMTLLSLFALI